jgi:hypothetical protein
VRSQQRACVDQDAEHLSLRPAVHAKQAVRVHVGMTQQEPVMRKLLVLAKAPQNDRRFRERESSRAQDGSCLRLGGRS